MVLLLKSKFSPNYIFSNGGQDISINSTPIDLKFPAYVPLDIIYGLTGAFFEKKNSWDI